MGVSGILVICVVKDSSRMAHHVQLKEVYTQRVSELVSVIAGWIGMILDKVDWL